jgi:NTE family protein
VERAANARAPRRFALERRGEAAASRVALVLGAGGSRGAYEAGVLAYLFEEIYPQLPPGFEFDIVSGTSVGALHAAYLAATAHEPTRVRASRLVASWSKLRLSDVLRTRDLVAFPFRALGMLRVSAELAALERVVRESIPWRHLARNLAAGTPGVLCVPCTHVGSGQATLFMDGPLADATPWKNDPHVRAELVRIEEPHVRASGAIPFLFPAVQIGAASYVDGALRVGTPVSPAVRLGADRVPRDLGVLRRRPHAAGVHARQGRERHRRGSACLRARPHPARERLDRARAAGLRSGLREPDESR